MLRIDHFSDFHLKTPGSGFDRALGLVEKAVGESVSRNVAHADKPHRVLAMHHSPFKERFCHGNWSPKNFADPAPREVMRWLKKCGATLALCGHVHRVGAIRSVALRGGRGLLRAGISGGHHHDKPECVASRGYNLIHLYDSGAMTLCCRLLPGADLS